MASPEASRRSHRAPRSARLLPAGPLAGLAACVAVFAVDAGLVAGHDTSFVDHPALTEAVHHRDSLLNSVMEAITASAEIPLVVLAVLVAAVLARRARSWRPIVLIGAAGVLSVAAATGVKDIADRTRPPHMYWLTQETGFSFPSRHTTMTAALLPVIAYLLCELIRSRLAKATVWGLAVVLIVLVGSSRVYLAVHWASDVLGGMALGGTVALLLVTGDRIVRGMRGPLPAGERAAESDTVHS
jgi:undecaprenyl-diphosphatase